jgi:hypothetical protein
MRSASLRCFKGQHVGRRNGTKLLHLPREDRSGKRCSNIS